MTWPLLTHRPDFSLNHVRRCEECWALAVCAHGRRQPQLFVDHDSRSGGTVERVDRARVMRRVADLSQGYFG